MTESRDTPPKSEPAIRMIAMPADANPPGGIFGGYITSLTDMAGGAAAFEFTAGQSRRRRNHVPQGRHGRTAGAAAGAGHAIRPVLIAIAWCLTACAAIAGEADVVKVRIAHQGATTYRFDVTVRHADAGWKHYADKWDVVAPNGKILGTRVLLHPHELEQPFTRSMSGVRIPRGIEHVTVRAHDKVHGDGGAEITVDVPRGDQGS